MRRAIVWLFVAAFINLCVMGNAAMVLPAGLPTEHHCSGYYPCEDPSHKETVTTVDRNEWWARVHGQIVNPAAYTNHDAAKCQFLDHTFEVVEVLNNSAYFPGMWLHHYHGASILKVFALQDSGVIYLPHDLVKLKPIKNFVGNTIGYLASPPLPRGRQLERADNRR